MEIGVSLIWMAGLMGLTGQPVFVTTLVLPVVLIAVGFAASSSYLRDETVQGFQVPAERIQVIPNFVDTKLYHRDKKPCYRSAFASEGEKVLMHVSNFRPVKRVEDVVEVFARVRRRVPSKLVMVGDGVGVNGIWIKFVVGG